MKSTPTFQPIVISILFLSALALSYSLPRLLTTTIPTQSNPAQGTEATPTPIDAPSTPPIYISVVTHNEELARRMDYVVRIHDGRIAGIEPGGSNS